MPARDFATDMIRRWREAAWPVRFTAAGTSTPLAWETRGRIVECRGTVMVFCDDGCASVIPPLSAATRVEGSTSDAGATEIRLLFPSCRIVIDDCDEGGSHAVH